MANLENLDEEALRAKLEEATSYEERAAIRQALRSLKKQRGEQVGGSKGARRGASYYNRFAGASRSVSIDKKPQSFVPSGSKSPSVTPVRSTTPSSASRSPVPIPTSPSPVTSPDPSMEEEEKRRQRQREIEEQERQREEERKEIEWQKGEEKRMEEEERRIMEEDRRMKEEERQMKEEQRRMEEEEKERQLQMEQEEQERERQRVKEEQEKEWQREEAERQREEAERQREEAERQREEQGNDEEGPRSPPPSPVDNEHEKEWVMVDKYHAHQLEREAAAVSAQDQVDGQGSSFGVQLRSTHSVKSSPAKKGPEPKAEFQQFQLRKTQSPVGQKRTSGSTEPISLSKSNFGVKLKGQEQLSNAPPTSTTTQHPRAQTYAASAGHKGVPATGGRGGAPRTLADFQRISSKAQGQVPPGASAQYHSSLVAYVNTALQLHPPLSPSSLALYDTCSNPSLLCKLINKSVRNTVDLRALTRTPPPSQAASREEALQENMTLVVESARAIGCRVDDNMAQRILGKDPETIRTFLLDLIRARVVHMPGMDEEPSSTFENVTLMLEKLGISSCGSEDTDQPQPREEAVTWKEKDSQRLREVLEKETEEPCPISGSWREKAAAISPPPPNQTSTAAVTTAPDKPSLDAGLTYEERAAQRRAERERRRKEREALAIAK